jgi:hypothetical protein
MTPPNDKKLKQQLMDDMIVHGCAQTKTTEVDGKIVVERIEPDEPLTLEVRRAMSFDETVERYRSQIKPNETPEERAYRINRFRCGY